MDKNATPRMSCDSSTATHRLRRLHINHAELRGAFFRPPQLTHLSAVCSWPICQQCAADPPVSSVQLT